MPLTQFDKQLLNCIQTGLPLTPAPFADIAAQLGCNENEVISHLASLQAQGVIHRFGAFFNAESLGYLGWLVAVKVLPEFLSDVALTVNAWPQVTHNDERDHDYNLWFTLQTRKEATMRELINKVKTLPGVEEVICMPTAERYKVNVEFHME